MENNADEVAPLLSHAVVLLSLAGAQVLYKLDTWILVTVGAQAQDDLNVWRFVRENDTTGFASLLSQALVFVLLIGAQMRDGQ